MTLPDQIQAVREARTNTGELSDAIREFEFALPGWWWSVCHCQITRDASCGPDFRVLGIDHPHVITFDGGFHDDNPGTLAEALRCVMQEALDQIAALDAGLIPKGQTFEERGTEPLPEWWRGYHVGVGRASTDAQRIATALAALNTAPDVDPARATRAEAAAVHAANMAAWVALMGENKGE